MRARSGLGTRVSALGPAAPPSAACRVPSAESRVPSPSRVALALLAALACAPRSPAPLPESAAFVNGQPWLDTDGKTIEAHAGGILKIGDRYWWYGENHALGSGNKTGISAYSSHDLARWKSEGVVMPKDSFPELFRDRGVAERPKVLYNRRTKRYVMWMHLDANRYQEASAGVAVAERPEGPFRMVKVFRPIAWEYAYSREEATLKERERGNSYRDMGLFQDDDGTAYAIYSSESNVTLYAVRLNADYTDIERPVVEGTTWARIIPNGRREAPAPFKYEGKYYLITSGLTGWAPNPAQYHVADHMLGPWRLMGNPVVGPEAGTTYRSQSTFVLPVPSACDACFVFMADRWDGRALEKSTYVWLPFVVAPDGTIRIEPRERWDMGAFRALRREAAAAPPTLGTFGQGWARSSVNAVVFRTSSVVTHDSTQYAAWYDGEGRVMLAKRRYGTGAWESRATPYRGNVRDAHNAIVLGVDGRGVLHVAWDHHGQPLNYARAVAPGSLELGEPQRMTGQHEDQVTYPQFYALANGDLLFSYRQGRSGKGDVMLNRFDAKAGTWSAVRHPLIDGEGARNAYINPIAVDARGGWHVSWVWRETPDVATNHDILYAYSPDSGRTWRTSAGAPYTLPITQASAEVVRRVPQGSGLINQTSMTVDARGRPMIATYWRPEGSEVPQYHLVWHDGTAWRTSQVGTRTTGFRLEGAGTRRIPMSRPQVMASPSGEVYVVFRDEERGPGITVACAADSLRSAWRVSTLDARPVGAWEPTYDPVAWARDRRLSLFHQRVGQGQGETLEDVAPQPVGVLEWTPSCAQ